MKLKSKIIIITSVILFLSLFFSNFFILFAIKKSMIKEAISAGQYNSLMISNDFNKAITEKNRTDYENIYYYLKDLNNDYILCFSYDNGKIEEYFNKTIYTYEKINEMENKVVRSEKNQNDNYFSLDKSNHIYCFNCSSNNQAMLYYIADLTPVYQKFYSYLIFGALVSVIIILIAVLILFLVIKKSFAPLLLLSKEAKFIADGQYNERINIVTNDEIAELSRDFNIMAESVENHNKEILEQAEKRLLFIGSLTHELRTPLTAIQGYSETMLNVKLSNEDEKTALLYINSESKRLNRLSNKMMDILKLKEGELLSFKEVFLNDIFLSVKRLFETSKKYKNINFLVVPTNYKINTDEDLLLEVIINLTDNAIKAMPNGGDIVLYEENGKIAVKDNGIGIEKEEIPKICDPFYRVDKSRSRKNGGAGLGLYLTSLILERLSMKLDIESEIGVGTTIFISLD